MEHYMAILNIFSSLFANTARENYSHLTKGLCNNYLEGGGGVILMGGPKVKLWCWVVGGGGGRCQFVKHGKWGYKLY